MKIRTYSRNARFTKFDNDAHIFKGNNTWTSLDIKSIYNMGYDDCIIMRLFTVYQTEPTHSDIIQYFCL